MATVAVGSRIASRVVASDVAVGARVHHGSDCSGDRRAGREHVRPL